MSNDAYIAAGASAQARKIEELQRDRDAWKARAWAAEERLKTLGTLRDNQEFMMEYIEDHYPHVMDEAEHALSEWDGKS